MGERENKNEYSLLWFMLTSSSDDAHPFQLTCLTKSGLSPLGGTLLSEFTQLQSVGDDLTYLECPAAAGLAALSHPGMFESK